VLPQLSNKQRRARQLPPATSTSTKNAELSDGTPMLPDQTTA